MITPQLLVVPGLRDPVEQHWQTLLTAQWPGALSLAPLGRDNLYLEPRIEAMEDAVQSSTRPVLLVAHSGGCVLVAHWARRTRLARRVVGALLAVPPTFEAPLPPPYPSLHGLAAHGWLPVPRQRLPFPSIVALSRNDVLGPVDGVMALARDWGSTCEDLGHVGHLNPASGFGPWPLALPLIARLAHGAAMTTVEA